MLKIARIVNIFHCARCGKDHEQLEFVHFERPISDSDGAIWNYWATCPTNGDPIIMMLITNKVEEKDINVPA